MLFALPNFLETKNIQHARSPLASVLTDTANL